MVDQFKGKSGGFVDLGLGQSYIQKLIWFFWRHRFVPKVWKYYPRRDQ